MNIVFLLRYWPIFGGGETVTLILANKLAALGYNVSVVYLWERKRNEMPFIDNRISQCVVSDISDPGTLYSIRKSDYRLLTEFLYQHLLKYRIDIIINQWWPARLVYKAKVNTKVKLISCHHMNVMQKPVANTIMKRLFYFLFGKNGVALRKYIHRRRLQASYTYSDKWVMLCGAFIEECKELFNINNNNGKICAIPNPLTYENFISEREITKKERELLFVGRISEAHKRISYILKAWSTIEQSGEFPDWKLTIVGDGPDLDFEKDLSRKYQCKRIHFEGHQNPLEYYKRAAIFLMTSENEGWPMTLVEAQQNGCVPVVMESFASVHEIIQNDVNGLIVKNDDIPEYVSALTSLMSNDVYRLKLAGKGLETCRQFTADRVVRQWETLFRELIQ